MSRIDERSKIHHSGTGVVGGTDAVAVPGQAVFLVYPCIELQFWVDARAIVLKFDALILIFCGSNSPQLAAYHLAFDTPQLAAGSFIAQRGFVIAQ